MPQRPTLSDDTVQHAPVADETVRMRTDGPAPDGGPQVPVDAADDTRPVTRDWLLGAPDADPPPSPAASEDDWSTQAFDRTPAEEAPAATDPLAHGTAALGGVPDEHGTAHAHEHDAGDDGTGVPGGPPPGDGPPEDGPRAPWWRRRAVLAPAGLIAVLAALYGVDLLVSSGDIPRSTVVAGVDIGGLSPAAASAALEEKLAPRVQADHTVIADDVESTLSPATAGITLDVDRTLDAADDQPLNPWTRLVTLFSDREVAPVITGEETALAAQIETLAAQVDRAPVDATITIDGTTPTVADPADGWTLDR
jgi:hypothetical protein